ncbi:hypothetical protein Gotri_003808, partial [Gossypium trilobum]|nr:hypothetical protein [Gossypium trilobum]
IGQSHPTGLTANLLKLFEPRPPLEFKPPPEKRKCPPYTGMAQFVSHFAEPGDPEYSPPVQEAETPLQRRARIHKLRLEKGLEKAAEELKNYDPNNDPNVSGDPYKTLFVARLNYETSESRIKREFESYGPIKRVRLVTDKSTNKPRGYAFIEYMHTRDMKAAYKQADGRKIDGRRVLVDVERGRTVPNWRPRRLGGGLGTTRIGGEDVTQREQIQSGPSRSEEPRIREDRHGDREDRHHRDRERTRDRDRDRERDRGGRDRDRARERGRDRGRDYERDRERDRERERDRDYDAGEYERDRGRSRDRDRESDYDRVESKHERDRHSERDYDHGEPDEDRGWYEQHDHGHRRSDPDDQHYEYYDHHRGRGEYDLDAHGDRYDQYSDRDRDRDRYDGMEEDDYR